MDEWVKTKLTDWGLRKYIEAFEGKYYTEKTGVSNFECQTVDSQSELLDSTTLFPKFFLFGQGDTHLIFCLTVTRVSESL